MVYFMCAGTVGVADADSAWKVYIPPLWVAMITGTDLPAQDATPAGEQLQQWSGPLYDTLMSATMDALRNLDLEYRHASEDMPDQARTDTAIAPEVLLYLSPDSLQQTYWKEMEISV